MQRSALRRARVCAPLASVLMTLSITLTLLAIGGCQAPPTKAADHWPPDDVAITGESVQGRAIHCRTLGDGPDVVMIVAAIHGNESAGTPLVQRLGEELSSRPLLLLGRTVVLVSVANPDGVASKTRFNAHGVDVNRNFPAANRQASRRNGRTPLSEPEAAALHALIDQHQPRRVVSIHQPLACVDYDGPAEPLAQRIAGLCGLKVRRLGALPGSMGSYVGVDRGAAIVTLELPRHADDQTPDALWRRYGQALVAAVTFDDPSVAAAPPRRPAAATP